MSVGDGIFWGAFFLSVVGLYLGTKDRWPWRKIVKRGFGAVGLLVGLSAGGWYAVHWYEERPHLVSKYWDIQLGMSKADVLVAKGEPESRQEGDREWQYKPSDKWIIQLFFTDDKVTSVLAAGDKLHMPNIANISAYISMEDLIGRYGQPSAVTTSDDGLARTLNFQKYNVVATFSKGELIAGGIDADLSKPKTFGKAASGATP